VKLYLKEDRPLIYFSGGFPHGITEEDLIKVGCKYRCFAYAYVAKEGFYYQKRMAEGLKLCVDRGVGIMMDSSAHSFHKLISAGLRKSTGKWTVRNFEELRKKTLKDYAKFVQENHKDWDWYVNFDYVKQCPIVWEMQQTLEEMGIHPVPVYHGDQPIDWLKRYIDKGYKLICLGSVRRNNKDVRYYYDQCFNAAKGSDVLFHALAVGSISIMGMYDWYSVDNASWAKAAVYGSVLWMSDSSKDIFSYLHLTPKRRQSAASIEWKDLSKSKRQEVAEIIKEDGFNVKELIEDGSQRCLYNMYVMSTKISHLKPLIRRGKVQWKSLLPA
jgi:hypothetical protein